MTILPRQISSKLFPALTSTNHTVTSDIDVYNCAAYVIDDKVGWCQPLAHPHLPTFWAPNVSRTGQISSYVEFYQAHGYTTCNDGSDRANYSKIVIYGKGDQFLHVAKLLGNNVWTSKLGRGHDISHSLDGLIGKLYGSPLVFMERHMMARPNPGKVVTRAGRGP